MTINFEHYAQKGNLFLNELAAELGTGDRDQAARITRAVFHTLRDTITVHESLQLLAQLPMALKAVYVDGWRIENHKRLKSEEEFLFNIANEDSINAWKDFSDITGVRIAVIITFRVMRNYVSDGEFNDIQAVLPDAVKYLVEESAY